MEMFEADAPRILCWWREVVVDRGALIAVCEVMPVTSLEREVCVAGGRASWGSERASLEEPQP